MLIEFKITNFRSIKEEQTLSFLPSGKLKKRANPLIKVSKYKDLKLLSSCVVYGPNNAGKSNTLKAFHAMRYLVTKSHGLNLGDKLEPNEAFHFDTQTQKAPTTFQIDFIAKDEIRYNYLIVFDKEKIYQEELYFYPNHDSDKLKSSKLFVRKENTLSFGTLFKNTKKGKDVASDLLDNNLFLSLAVKRNLQQFNYIYLYFKNHITTSIFHDTSYDKILLRSLGEFIYKEEDKVITNLIEKIIVNSDAGIVGIEIISDENVPQINFPEGFPEEKRERIRKNFIERFQYEIQTLHRLYENGKEIGTAPLPLKEQSTGTKKYLSMLRLILEALRDGDLFIVDELDKSLHTEWTQLLITLFHNPKTNPNHAQLIFATHDTNLLGNDKFNRDQIYMIAKNRFGASELYALSSFSGLRDTTPIEKWYLSERFGAVPQINTNQLTKVVQNSPIFNE